jgi:hypothetical protein
MSAGSCRFRFRLLFMGSLVVEDFFVEESLIRFIVEDIALTTVGT